MKIKNVFAREILDSNGQPTVEAEVTLENGIVALGGVPSGVSIGKNEAVELRDGDVKRYFGKGVLKAVENIKTEIRDSLVGKDAYNQKEIDELLISLDGTKDKSRLGANAILGVSMAVCRAAARSQKVPLWKYFGKLSGNSDFLLPTPLFLLLEGGKHGNWETDVQEFFVVPKKEKFFSFKEMLRVGTEIYYSLKKILDGKNYSLGVGLEGAFCPKEICSNEEGFTLLSEAVEKAGYSLGEDIFLGIDIAAGEFFENGKYILKSEQKTLSSEEWTEKLSGWIKAHSIFLTEDPFSDEAWEIWSSFTKSFGEVLVVGDDLLATNIAKIQKAALQKAVSGVIIKPNQVGTISETIEAIKLSLNSSLIPIISHRSGETNDDMIADMAVGCNLPFCKFGSPARGERVAKYNRLLRIEEKLNF